MTTTPAHWGECRDWDNILTAVSLDCPCGKRHVIDTAPDRQPPTLPNSLVCECGIAHIRHVSPLVRLWRDLRPSPTLRVKRWATTSPWSYACKCGHNNSFEVQPYYPHCRACGLSAVVGHEPRGARYGVWAIQAVGGLLLVGLIAVPLGFEWVREKLRRKAP